MTALPCAAAADTNAPSDGGAAAFALRESEAAYLLEALGVIDRDDYWYEEEEGSRAEFCGIMVAASGIGNGASDTFSHLTFLDVDASRADYGDISAAAGMGYLSGFEDGTVRPDEAVTYEQAVKMALSVLGYDEYAKQNGGFPSGYLQTARERQLLRGMDFAYGANLSRGAAVQITFNMLNTDMMALSGVGNDVKYAVERGATLLRERHDTARILGRVTGNHLTRLTGKSELGKGVIEIGGARYREGNTNAARLLGYHVRAYVRDDDADGGADGTKTILYIAKDDGKNDEISVNARDILSSTSVTEFYYQDGDVRKRAQISADADMIYNAKASAAFDDAMLKPLMGEVTLLDTDRDGKYDVIFTTSYDTYVVQSAFAYEREITDKYDNETIRLGGDGVLYSMTRDGAAYPFENLKEWDVLSVARSADKQYYGIIVSTDTVNGEVTEIVQNEAVTIDSGTYELSESFKRRGVPLALGDTGNFYLDSEGEIAAVSSDASDGKKYGFLMKLAKNTKGLDNYVEMLVLTSNGRKEVFRTAEKLYVNDAQIKAEEIESVQTLFVQGPPAASPWGAEDWYRYNYCRPMVNGVKQQLIAYKTTPDGLLERLYLSDYDETTDNTPDPETLLKLNSKSFTNADLWQYGLWYNDWNKMFKNGVSVNDKTLIFVIPHFTTDEEGYKCIRRSQLPDNKGYYAEIYDVDEFNTAKAMVIWDREDLILGLTSGVGMFDGFAEGIDSRGNTIQKMRVVKDGGAQTYDLNEDAMYYNIDDRSKPHIRESVFEGLKNPSLAGSGKGILVYYRRDADNVIHELRLFTTPNYDFEGQDKYPVGLVRKTDGKQVMLQSTFSLAAEVNGDEVTLLNIDPNTISDADVTRVNASNTDTLGGYRLYNLGNAAIYLYAAAHGKIAEGTPADVAPGNIILIDYHWGAKNIYVFTKEEWARMAMIRKKIGLAYPLANQ
jgi:hypothetical protein